MRNANAECCDIGMGNLDLGEGGGGDTFTDINKTFLAVFRR